MDINTPRKLDRKVAYIRMYNRNFKIALFFLHTHTHTNLSEINPGGGYYFLLEEQLPLSYFLSKCRV